MTELDNKPERPDVGAGSTPSELIVDVAPAGMTIGDIKRRNREFWQQWETGLPRDPNTPGV